MKTNCTHLSVFVDAAVHPDATGLGVVFKSEAGEVIGWHKARRGAMTCNEAEYEALIFALRLARDYLPRFRRPVVHIHSDSRVVIEQMTGAIGVRNDRLRMLHRLAQAEARRFKQLIFTHIPRGRNELADALAEDAIAPSKPVIHEQEGRLLETREVGRPDTQRDGFRKVAKPSARSDAWQSRSQPRRP